MGGKKRILVTVAFSILFLIISTLVFVFSGGSKSSLDEQGVVGFSVPNIYVMGLDRKNYPLAEVVQKNSERGIRTVVSLWATWCDPCRRELPLLKKAKQELHDEKIEVLLINYDDGPPERAIPEIQAWLIANQIQELDSYFDFKQDLMKKIQVGGLPFAFAVGTDGKILWTRLGELKWSSKELFP